jgi:hypothetical protein
VPGAARRAQRDDRVFVLHAFARAADAGRRRGKAIYANDCTRGAAMIRRTLRYGNDDAQTTRPLPGPAYFGVMLLIWVPIVFVLTQLYFP